MRFSAFFAATVTAASLYVTQERLKGVDPLVCSSSGCVYETEISGLVAEEDQEVTIQRYVGDDNWYIGNIYDKNFKAPWFVTESKYAGRNVTVYILDTGVELNHEQFAGRVIGDEDQHGHGTHCCGLLTGKYFGLAPGAQVVSVRVLDQNGSGNISAVVKAVAAIVDNHPVKIVISMSLGAKGSSEALNIALQAADEAGIVTLAAASNEGDDACRYMPASSPHVITVGAYGKNGQRSSFSNYGKCVDVYAPGEEMLSSFIGCGYKKMKGTSMATPLVAGWVAQLLEKGTVKRSAVLKAITKADKKADAKL